jgi:ATP-dependent Lon protease
MNASSSARDSTGPGAPDETRSPIPPSPAAPALEKPEEGPIPDILPILPVRNLVLFPGTVVPLSISRPASLKLLEENLSKSTIIGTLTQKTPDQDNPAPDDLYRVGTAARVLKLLRQADNQVVVVLLALQRIRIREFVQTTPYLRASVEAVPPASAPKDDPEWEAAIRHLRDSAAKLMELTPDVPDEVRTMYGNIEDAAQLIDFIASSLNLPSPDRQALLEELDLGARLRAVQNRVSSQLEIARIQEKLQKDVTSQFTDQQRRAYLREQVKAIQRELGEADQGLDEQVEELRKRLTDAKPPQAITEQAERELRRLQHIPAASPEFSVIVSYLEILADLPWNKLSDDALDLAQARQILDRDHFDLEKVKRRLIEYLAVRKLNPEGRGPILCFLGPPGVGKTSLGQSIADALGRKFARFSLGGMRDEAEIRGHRRTYIGSMPGRLIQEFRRLGTRNPVIMLDEIDKLGTDFRGDPASALLEVLDPRQNHAFVDHYLDVPFDLSQVIFIATANYMDAVPSALRDRMEVIDIPGYTEHDKLEIAKRYLVGRQLKENGLRPDQCPWDDSAIRSIIEDYTREAGVRELERQIGSVCRSVAAQVADDPEKKVRVDSAFVRETLGAQRFIRETRLKTNRPGVVTGLAYTPVGGEVLHIEAISYSGKGNITLTGQIGNVMKESVHAALSLVRSRQSELGIRPRAFQDLDIHVHVPAGAVPKDGPSAGVAMFTALASLFTQTPVRATVAMTGEITLRGLVLPIGGLKEKALAALRAGIEHVIIPKLNEKDLPDIPEEARRTLQFTLVENVDEVLEAALDRPPLDNRDGKPEQARRVKTHHRRTAHAVRR